MRIQSTTLLKEHLSSGCKQACALLSRNGYETYVVGGAVRDILCGIEPSDFDIVTSAPFDRLRTMFPQGIAGAGHHQVLQVQDGGGNIELSTLARLSASLPVEPPGSPVSDRVAHDAWRRDFSVNSLYYSPVQDALIDPYGGLADLEERVIRLLGDAHARFAGEPALMLRAVRFASRLRFSMHGITEQAIRENAHRVLQTGPHRLIPELLSHLLSGHALESMRTLCRYRLHKSIIPDLDRDMNEETGHSFLGCALRVLDAAGADRASLSSSLACAILLWPQTKRIHAAQPEVARAGRNGINDMYMHLPCPDWLLPRFWREIVEIYSTQALFEQCEPSAAKVLQGHKRFRAGFSLLQLRCESGELDSSVPAWWKEELAHQARYK